MKRKQIKVYVLDINGNPLMPTSPRNAKKLLKERYGDVEEVFGYITKNKRLELKLEKSHVNDAFCIANGDLQKRSSAYNIIQKRKNNRKLQIQRKGKKRSIRRKRYKIQPYDIVEFEGKKYRSKGICNYGKSVRAKDDDKDKYLSVKKLKNIFNVKTFVYI